MRHRIRAGLVAAASAALAVGVQAAGDEAQGNTRNYSARLVSYQEVPAASSGGVGEIRLTIDDDAQTIEYQLAFAGLEAGVTQAHIHFAQPGVNGGVMLWLCGTATNPGPAGTPACPADGDPNGVSGILGPANVVINAQGITPGEFAEAVAAIRAGVAYANVHTTRLPGGEIRGQLRPGGGHK
jgi:hypothetical protein